MTSTVSDDRGIHHHEQTPAPRARIPGELPSDPSALPRDTGPCSACGTVALLVAGGDVCERCDAVGRAAAQPRRPALASVTAPVPAAHLERLGSRYVVAVRYIGSPHPWLELLGDFVVRHVPGDGGGLLYVMRAPEVGRRLHAGPPAPRAAARSRRATP